MAAGRRGLRRVRRRRHHPGPRRSGHRPQPAPPTRTTAPGQPSRTTPPCPRRSARRAAAEWRTSACSTTSGQAPPRTPTTSRPGSSRTGWPATTPRTSPRRLSHEVGHNFGLSHDGTRRPRRVQQRQLLLRPRDVGADHGRRLPEAGRAVEQGRVRQRQQHPERPERHRRRRRPGDRRRGRRHGRDRCGRDPGPGVHHLGRRLRHLRARDLCGDA